MTKLREQIAANLREQIRREAECTGPGRCTAGYYCPVHGPTSRRWEDRNLPDRTSAGEPVEAVATDGIVMILVDSTTARQLAHAWKFVHGHGGIDSAARPTYPLDVATILRAAIDADRQASVELHPHANPGDGRQECQTCGKWVWLVTHSCKGVPVTQAAMARLLTCPCGCPRDAHVGEIGCPCGLPDEPPCVAILPESKGGDQS